MRPAACAAAGPFDPPSRNPGRGASGVPVLLRRLLRPGRLRLGRRSLSSALHHLVADLDAGRVLGEADDLKDANDDTVLAYAQARKRAEAWCDAKAAELTAQVGVQIDHRVDVIALSGHLRAGFPTQRVTEQTDFDLITWLVIR